MISTATVRILTISLLIVLGISQLNIYVELQEMKNGIQKPAGLTLNNVVEIVEERLSTQEKKKYKQILSDLEQEYELAAPNLSEGKLVYGYSGARLTLKEFADIECPYCRRMHDGIKQVVDHSQGTINWEFKHFPLGRHNPVAAIESQAIECIRESYGNRKAWIALDRFIVSTTGNGKGVGDISEFVRTFGLSGSLMANCLASDDHKEKINKDYSDGRSSGVTSTPAILVLDNNTGKEFLIKGYKTPDQLLQAIQQVLSL